MRWDETELLLAALGGVLFGLAATMTYVVHGRTAGISGILGGLLLRSGGADFRLAFLLGLAIAGAAAAALDPGLVPGPSGSLERVAVAGVLVGVGVRLGNGCTSGHGICGVSNGTRRSVTATVLFTTVGMITATVVGALP